MNYFIRMELGLEKNRIVVVLSNAICNDSDDTAYTDYLGYILMQK